MALAVVAYMEEDREERVGRIFRDRTRPLEIYSDREMMARYRLDRETFMYVLQVLTPLVERPTKRSHALSPETIVSTALRYFAGASLLRDNGDIHGINRQSVSRCIHQVANCIVRTLMQRHLAFPQTEAEIIQTMQGFYDMKGFPSVVGCIDGTLVPIKGPTDAESEPLFVTRKYNHCINVQGVCNADLKFTNIVAKWPGSTHDSHIWKNSELFHMFRNGGEGGVYDNLNQFWLLGDSGYKCVPHLLTPLADCVTRGEKEYNKCHRRTRCCIERCFGVWKSRFMCLHKWGGCMIFSPQKCCHIIMATAILHNICRDRRLPVVNDRGERVPEEPEVEEGEPYNGQDDDAGRRVRSDLIERIFNHRRT